MPIVAIKLAKYAKGYYLKQATEKSGLGILCILPVEAERIVHVGITGRPGLINLIKRTISGYMEWNRRVFIAAKMADGRVMLILLKRTTTEDALSIMKEKSAEELDLSHLDTSFSTMRHVTAITLDQTVITKPEEGAEGDEESIFTVVPKNQGNLFKNAMYKLKVVKPKTSAGENELGCFEESQEWLCAQAV